MITILDGVVMRAALLTFGTLIAISLWGMAVYTDGAVASHTPVDGYGVSIAQTK
ncbi:MAG: hypothetical protein AAFY99_07320 [Pseudomonadota bacterium]